MYRLLKSKLINLNGLQELSLCKSTNQGELTPIGRRKDFKNSFNVFINGNVRFQSTSSNTNLKSKKVRRKRAKANKKYVELLVVTDNSTTEYKAKVQNLKAKDLGLLALSNLKLNELYKLKSITSSTNSFEEHTYNNLTVIENDPVIDNIPNETSVINEKQHVPLDEEDMIDNKENVILEDIIPLNEIKFENFESEEIVEEESNHELEDISIKAPIKLPPKELNARAHEEVIHRTLAAYMEVCGMHNPYRAFSALAFHRVRSINATILFPKLKDVNIYNALITALAMRNDFNKLQDVVKFAKDDGVQFNVQSYVAIFDCLAKINYKDNHLKQIRIYVKEALRQNITFDKIMNEGIFENDQRENVLKTMQSYDPDYVPKYAKPDLQYCNTLLNHLNDRVQLEAPSVPMANKSPLTDKKSFEAMIEEQMNLEKAGYVVVKSIGATSNPSAEVVRYRKAYSELLNYWREEATAAFNRDLNALTAKRGSLTLEPYMRCLPAKDFITIILDEAVKIAQGSETYSPTVSQLYRELGYKVYQRFRTLRKQKSGILNKIQKIHNEYCQFYASEHPQLDILPTDEIMLNSRQKWQWIENSMSSNGSSIKLYHQDWVVTISQNIGKFLYHIIMHDLKIDVNCMKINKPKNYLPAFYTIFRHQGRIVKEEVKPHPILSKLYRFSMPETLTFMVNEVPMKCPPIPWVSINTGGYLLSPCDVVRLPPQALTQKQRLATCNPNQLYPPFDALNQLASVPWMVNKDILAIIIDVFQMGGSIKLDVPQPPSALMAPPSFSLDMDKHARYENFKQRLQYKRKKGEMYSLWCDCLYRLSLANHYKDDTFWLPHNMDFRGRVYPIPPHLNHLGSDLARSMLVFAESRPLGPNGLDWLKLHLINLTGLKKRDPISDRLVFANEIMDKILDSADKPLTGKMWWAEAEEPWQALACCMEIAKAHRSDNPEQYRSHFPVHQDGSCNGLQHYAALGRDSAGAHSVNLTPSRVPQDVYSAVAVLVEEKRRIDAESGLEIAKVLEGYVKRKVIKQTVMTTVYGVTRFGARLQIARQLKDIESFPKDQVWAASSYLTTRTFDSLRTMFTSTKEIQDWFTECARLISSICGENVEWVTPMGLPIVQPYLKSKPLNTSAKYYENFHNDKYERPNVMKQKNAFPPNFIHSLDSSHMMLTSLNCERAGITFVSVHDCYWTHPSTVHIMNKVCREQFVALHSQPILESLSEFLDERYSYSEHEFADDGSLTDLTKRKLNKVLRQLPKTGDFNIEQVLDSVYFFS